MVGEVLLDPGELTVFPNELSTFDMLDIVLDFVTLLCALELLELLVRLGVSLDDFDVDKLLTSANEPLDKEVFV